MRRTLLILGMWAGLLPTGASAGGGNGLEWDRPHHVIGERVEGLTSIPSRYDVTAHEPYFAYLIRYREGLEWPDAPHLPRDAKIVAPVQLGAGALRNGAWVSVRAFVTFPAPSEAGQYVVSLCNRPCTHRLGDVFPTSLRVYPSEVEARLVPKIAGLRWRVRKLMATSDKVLSRVETHGELEAERRGDLTARVDELERTVKAMRAASKESNTSPLLPTSIAVLLAVVYLVGRRSKRDPTISTAPDIDKELTEMTLVDVSRERDVSRSP